MTQLRLYDRLRDEIVDVEPSTPGVLRVYSCGPTVYGRIHVGNARPYWTAMVLKRASERLLGLPARVAINITDVNDKIYTAAVAQGVPSQELADRMADAYRADTDGLGLGRPDAEPLASQTIPEIVALIERLIEEDAAYATDDGDVYFSVQAYPPYGELSGQRPDELIAGSRVEPGEGKRSPLDFALWKANKPGEDTAWDSPWGRGRPGWHIECSAMARAQLGEDFDVHGGGLDLIFPHHENERAQSEAAGERFARDVDAQRHAPPHRREDVEVARQHRRARRGARARRARDAARVLRAGALPQSGGLLRLDARAGEVDRSGPARGAAQCPPLRGRGRRGEVTRRSGRRPKPPSRPSPRYMADDLDTPRALAELHVLARAINSAVAAGDAAPAAVAGAADLLVRALDVLGLASLDEEAETSEEAQALADERAAARAAGDYARADELRDRIAELGFTVRDTPQGPQVVPLDG